MMDRDSAASDITLNIQQALISERHKGCVTEAIVWLLSLTYERVRPDRKFFPVVENELRDHAERAAEFQELNKLCRRHDSSPFAQCATAPPPQQMNESAKTSSD